MNKFFASIFSHFFLLSAIVTTAQDYPYEVPRYPFINYEINQLTFKGASEPMDGFYRKLDTLLMEGRGKVNILHMGGSHIQADIWSGRLRKRLQLLQPGLSAGRGLMFPFHMARTNNPFSYYTEYTGSWSYCKNVQRSQGCKLGLTGMKVSTEDVNSTFTLILPEENEPKYTFHKFRVFYEQDSLSYIPVILDSSLVINSRIDSLSGFIEFSLSKSVHKIKIGLLPVHKSSSTFTLYGFQALNDEPGIVYHGVGVNGADVPAYLRCDLLEEHLRSVNPDLIIFSIGINDAYTKYFKPENYKSDYAELIKRIQTVVPDVAILFTTNNDSYYKRRHPNENGIEVKQAMMEMSATYDAAVWDMFSIMGGLNSVSVLQNHGLAKYDKIHFTREGYVLVGDLMFNAIFSDYEKHLKSIFSN